MKTREINVLVLAYLGDSIYENYVRRELIAKYAKVDQMQKAAVNYVSAKAQAKYIDQLITNDFLSEEEIDVFKRARNYKSSAHPKNTDIISYKKATGLEALIGFLYLEGKEKRIDEIMELILI